MLRAILFALLPLPAFACGDPICIVEPETLDLTRVITFDDVPSGWDPGHRIDELLVLSGATFAERFAGQSVEAAGNFDRVTGRAFSPLTLLPGAPGETLSVVNMFQTNILNGYGPAGYPRADAQGEGAIAVLFDKDQPALALDILGGEAGTARIEFLRRDGSVIHAVDLSTRGTMNLGFMRPDNTQDIAGFVITNRDPQGLAIDNVRFGPPLQLG